MVHEGLSNGELVYVDRYYHRVVLLAIIHTLEVLVRKGDGWHPRSKCHHVHLVHPQQVFLPGVVGVPSPGEAASYGFDNFSVTSSVGPRLSVVSVISVISTALW